MFNKKKADILNSIFDSIVVIWLIEFLKTVLRLLVQNYVFPVNICFALNHLQIFYPVHRLCY